MDFNSNGTTPTNWTTIAAPDTSGTHALIDFNTGSSSGITLQFTDDAKDTSANYTVSGWSNDDAPWIDNDALSDYFYLPADGTASYKLSNLDTSKTYKVELLAVRDSPSAATDYKVGGASVVFSDNGNSEGWSSRDDGYTDEGVMVWGAVTPDASNEITVNIVHRSSDVAFFNGMRISEVPEPSTFVMLSGLFGVGFGAWRLSRRRRNR